MLLRWRATVFSLSESRSAIAAVGEPGGHEAQHLDLARGERAGGRRPISSLTPASADARTESAKAPRAGSRSAAAASRSPSA